MRIAERIADPIGIAQVAPAQRLDRVALEFSLVARREQGEQTGMFLRRGYWLSMQSSRQGQ